MTYLIKDWFIVVAILAIAMVAAIAIYRFYVLPSAKQIETIKE